VRRKWNLLRRNEDCIANQALQCTIRGYRDRRRPKNTWRRDLETEIGTAEFKYSWRKQYKTDMDREKWSVARCSPRNENT